MVDRGRFFHWPYGRFERTKGSLLRSTTTTTTCLRYLDHHATRFTSCPRQAESTERRSTSKTQTRCFSYVAANPPSWCDKSHLTRAQGAGGTVGGVRFSWLVPLLMLLSESGPRSLLPEDSSCCFSVRYSLARARVGRLNRSRRGTFLPNLRADLLTLNCRVDCVGTIS